MSELLVRLHKIRERLGTHGWVQHILGAFTNPEARHPACLLGHAYAVLGASVPNRMGAVIFDDPDAKEELLHALNEAIEKTESRFLPHNTITSWNDEVDRTADDIIRVVEFAIKVEEIHGS